MGDEIETMRTQLARGPAVFRAMVAGLPAEWLEVPEAPGAWSAREVVCHVADLELDGWIPRARTIVERGGTVALPSIDRERFRTRYAGVPVEDVLEDFERLRGENLRELDGPELRGALDRTGRHEVLGEVRVSQLLSTWVVHDLTHQAQIARALAAGWREAVGPWRRFLSVLGAREEATSPVRAR